MPVNNHPVFGDKDAKSGLTYQNYELTKADLQKSPPSSTINNTNTERRVTMTSRQEAADTLKEFREKVISASFAVDRVVLNIDPYDPKREIDVALGSLYGALERAIKKAESGGTPLVFPTKLNWVTDKVTYCEFTVMAGDKPLKWEFVLDGDEVDVVYTVPYKAGEYGCHVGGFPSIIAAAAACEKMLPELELVAEDSTQTISEEVQDLLLKCRNARA